MTDDNRPDKEARFSPTAIMRGMHPDLFSDTTRSSNVQISRAALELQIDTLTSQNKEKEFEHFARQMAQRLICPRLRPQTGPTGGGDAKVDSESLVVAPLVAERWWVGEPAAGNERWAFAFSAKKAWKPKVESDVLSIVSTQRDYKRIYFVTNQNASDRSRSKAEDALSKAAGVPVSILDRNWLLTNIYENDLVELAVMTLGLTGNEVPMVSVGPLDAGRIATLEELERRLQDPTEYEGADYQLAEDALNAALQARGLERPRHEVEGRFLRAMTLADKGRYVPQQLRAAYTYAWTAHWWFEDFELFNRLYDRVEELGIDSKAVDDLEKVQNLWTLLSTAVARAQVKAADCKFDDRTVRLRSRLEVLAAEGGRPNNSLQAETSLALIDFAIGAAKRDLGSIAGVWNRLSDIVDRAEHLGSYPFEAVYDLAERVGEFADGPEFDALFEKLIVTIAKRRGEGETGEMLCRRAIQKMDHDRPYEAIRLFGRAEPLLVKEEYRGSMVKALVGGSSAYSDVGLPWASRAKALAAIDTCRSTFRREGEMPAIIMHAIHGLIWSEVRLGRVGNVIAGLALSAIHQQHASLSAELAHRFHADREVVDRIMGIHLLHASPEELEQLGRLPATLENMGLVSSAYALVYALGGAEKAIEEKFVPAEEPPASVDEMIAEWLSLPVVEDIADIPVLSVTGRSTLVSRVMGARLAIDTPDDATSFGVAESVLAAFEAFLATSHEQDIAPRTEMIEVVIEVVKGKGNAFTLTFDDHDTGTKGKLVRPSELAFESKEDFSTFTVALRDAVGTLLTRMFFVRNVEEWMTRLADEEKAFERALTLANLVVINGNVFGDAADVLLATWMRDQTETIAYTRAMPLPQRKLGCETPKDAKPRTVEQGPAPEELTNPELISHADRMHVSPINVSRWDRAQWRGTLYFVDPTPGVPPMLGVGFLDAEMGQKIFEELQERFGKYDQNDELRVAIIRGIDASEPHAYAVSIGPNLNKIDLGGSRIVTGLSRINRMTPKNRVNLDGFLKQSEAVGGFILMPAYMDPNNLSGVDVYPQFGIAKTTLVVRNAWELDEYDVDMMVLDAGATPVVPPGADASPVLRGLERRRQNEATRRGP